MSNLKDCIIDLAKLSKTYIDAGKGKDIIYGNEVDKILKLLKRYVDCDHALNNCECKLQNPNNWFEKLFGITEEIGSVYKWQLTKDKFKLEGNLLTAPNGEIFNAGYFNEFSLEELYIQVKSFEGSTSKIKVEHYVTMGVLEEHHKNPGATFQAASQLNYLEFVNFTVRPEEGITGYEGDPTQGPNCALACAAGTVVRNYFKNSPDNQLNMLSRVELIIGNTARNYFKVENGYISSLLSKEKLEELNKNELDTESKRDFIRNNILIGIHQNVGVCFKDRNFIPIPASEQVIVNQVYSSALSLGHYARPISDEWEPLGKLLLEADYEGTLLAAIISGSETVILTMVGGQAFGNPDEWIIDAINRAIANIRKLKVKLTIKIAHYKSFNEKYRANIPST
jgi:hypothetical protein